MQNICSGGGVAAEERVEGSLTGVAGGHEACKRGGVSLATRAKITKNRQRQEGKFPGGFQRGAASS